jgi:hypothetical protein
MASEQAAELSALEAGAGVGSPAAGVLDVPESIPTIELVRPVLAMACAAFVPAWEITGPEQEQLSGVYSAVLDKYFPGGMAMGPEVVALLVTASVVMPRLGKPRKTEEKPGGEIADQ